jgi:hypothetical protein
MTYASGQLIQAWDYNRIAWGGNTAAYTNSITNLAYVWGVGTGQFGYGQNVSAIAPVSSTNTVTAAQWSALILAVNGALGHQSGSAGQLGGGGNIGVTAGATVQTLANVVTAVSTINTNYTLYSAQGSTTTGSIYSPVVTAAAATAYAGTIATRTVTFASGDAARYFFNAGGQLNFVVTSVTNNDATARSGQVAVALALSSSGFARAAYNALTTSYVNRLTVTGGGSYTADSGQLNVQSSAQNASGNGDKGTAISFAVYLTSAAHAGFNDTLNVTFNHRIDIVYPETTYLTSSPWGTPVIS